MTRVNLGSADRYVDGWVNVDRAECPHRKDVTLDLEVGDLPWSLGSLTHVYAGHVLEHLEQRAVMPLLMDLLDCMTPDGQIMVVGPDVDRARLMVAAGTFDSRYHTLDSVVHGDHRWPGTQHKWECTGVYVRQLLIDVGWSNVTELDVADVPDFWPVIDRTQRWQFAVSATAEPVVKP